MNEQKRIEIPICETCQWFKQFGENNYTGECSIEPPIIVHYKVGEAYSRRPYVSRTDFCSHHKSAFVNETKQKTQPKPTSGNIGMTSIVA